MDSNYGEVKKGDQVKIGALTTGSECRAVYRRCDGRTYCLINKEVHAEVWVRKGGKFGGQGKPEKVNQNEVVTVVRNGIRDRALAS